MRRSAGRVAARAWQGTVLQGPGGRCSSILLLRLAPCVQRALCPRCSAVVGGVLLYTAPVCQHQMQCIGVRGGKPGKPVVGTDGHQARSAGVGDARSRTAQGGVVWPVPGGIRRCLAAAARDRGLERSPKCRGERAVCCVAAGCPASLPALPCVSLAPQVPVPGFRASWWVLGLAAARVAGHKCLANRLHPRHPICALSCAWVVVVCGSSDGSGLGRSVMGF